MAETAAKAIFTRYNTDGNGYLEPIEALQFISDLSPQQDPSKSTPRPEETMHNLLRVADENGDNKISMSGLTEFLLKVFEAKDHC